MTTSKPPAARASFCLATGRGARRDASDILARAGLPLGPVLTDPFGAMTWVRFRSPLPLPSANVALLRGCMTADQTTRGLRIRGHRDGILLYTIAEVTDETL